MLELSKRPAVRQELERVRLKLEAELAAANGSAKVTSVSAAPVAEPQAVDAPATKAPRLDADIPVEPQAADAPEAKASVAPVSATPAPKPLPVDVKPVGPWTEITTFALDLGGYDKPHVTVDLRMKGVESLPVENMTCDFTSSSLDLK